MFFWAREGLPLNEPTVLDQRDNVGAAPIAAPPGLSPQVQETRRAAILSQERIASPQKNTMSIILGYRSGSVWHPNHLEAKGHCVTRKHSDDSVCRILMSHRFPLLKQDGWRCTTDSLRVPLRSGGARQRDRSQGLAPEAACCRGGDRLGNRI